MSFNSTFEVSRRGFLTGAGMLSVLAGLGLAGCGGSNGSTAAGRRAVPLVQTRLSSR